MKLLSYVILTVLLLSLGAPLVGAQETAEVWGDPVAAGPAARCESVSTEKSRGLPPLMKRRNSQPRRAITCSCGRSCSARHSS